MQQPDKTVHPFARKILTLVNDDRIVEELLALLLVFCQYLLRPHEGLREFPVIVLRPIASLRHLHLRGAHVLFAPFGIRVHVDAPVAHAAILRVLRLHADAVAAYYFIYILLEFRGEQVVVACDGYVLADARKPQRIPHHHVRLSGTRHALYAHARVARDGFHHHLLHLGRFLEAVLVAAPGNFRFVGLLALAVEEVPQAEQRILVEVLVGKRHVPESLHGRLENFNKAFFESLRVEQVGPEQRALPRDFRSGNPFHAVHVAEAYRPLHAHLAHLPVTRRFKEFLHVFVKRRDERTHLHARHLGRGQGVAVLEPLRWSRFSRPCIPR